MKESFIRRLMTAALVLAVSLLTACQTMTFDPTGTKMTTAYAASPGLDGTTATRSDLYHVWPAFSKEEEAKAKSDREFLQQMIVSGRVKVDMGRAAVYGSEPLAAKIVVMGISAATGNLLSYAVQNRLQRNQQEFCASNSCGTQFFNVNNNETRSGAVSNAVSNTAATLIGGVTSVPACVKAGDCGR